jgi:hypothetical protein
MTLRGELDSFPLETVVQLIHSTNKTGQLEIRGDDSTGGTLGFDGGRLVAAIAGDDAGEPALGAIFAVSVGAFEFIPWNETPAANLSGDLDQLLDKAVEERDRIVAIRKVIPDDRSRFRLSERAAEKGDITLAPDQWRTLLAVNGERDLFGVAEHLKAGKLATRATLAALVESGFIDVLEPAADVANPASAAEPAQAHAPAPEQWSPPAPVWVAPAPEPQTWAPARPAEVVPAPEPEPQAWQPSASPTPLGPSWEQPAATQPAQTWEPAPAHEWEQPQVDLRADLAAALDARMSASAPVVEPEPVEQAPIEVPPVQDERLAALSGVFSPAPAEAAPAPEPVPHDRINEWSRMAAEVQAPPAPAEEKKKGLFGFLKKDEAAKDATVTTAAFATGGAPAASVGRAGQLASFSNALLAEYNSGQYGKGRLDDRMANLLMRVDEQAEPIDRPLPIVDDRIDAQALDRENVPEQQAVPYLAILVSQIYEDAERTFGKDKAKKGYRAAQQQVFGADASALTAPDVSGRLPKV